MAIDGRGTFDHYTECWRDVGCTRCGNVWLDPGELGTLAPEAHTRRRGDLISRTTGGG